MSFVVIILKIIVALSILNVWLVQQNKPTKWRGGAAKIWGSVSGHTSWLKSPERAMVTTVQQVAFRYTI